MKRKSVIGIYLYCVIDSMERHRIDEQDFVVVEKDDFKNGHFNQYPENINAI
jgi:hypothetical protein